MIRFALAAIAALTMGTAHAGQYDQLGSYSGQLRECFEQNMVTPRFNADTERALSIIVSAARLDRAYFQRTENVAYNTATAEVQFCRSVESEGYKIQARANQIVTSSNVSFNEPAMPQVNKPMWCNRAGNTMMCN